MEENTQQINNSIKKDNSEQENSSFAANAGVVIGLAAGTLFANNTRAEMALQHAKEIGEKHGQTLNNWQDFTKYYAQAVDNASIRPEGFDAKAQEYQNFWITKVKELDEVHKFNADEYGKILLTFTGAALVAGVVVWGAVDIWQKMNEPKPETQIDSKQMQSEKMLVAAETTISK